MVVNAIGRLRSPGEASLGTIASAGTLLTQGVVQFGGLTLYVLAFGTELAADWLVLFSLPALVSLLDLGFTAASSTAATRSFAAGDRRTGSTILWRAYRLLAIIACGLVIFAVMAPAVVDVRSVFGLRTLSAGEATIVFRALAGYSAVNFFCFAMESTWRAAGRFAQGLTVLNVIRLAEFAGAVVMAWLTRDPVDVALTLLVARVIMTATWAGYTVHKRKEVEAPWRCGLARPRGDSLTSASIGYALVPAGYVLQTQGLTIVASHYLDGSGIVVLAAARTMCALIRQGGMTLSLGPTPALTRALALRDCEGFLRVARRSRGISYMWAGLSGIATLVVGPLYFAHVLGQRYVEGLLVIVVFLIPSALDALWISRWPVVLSANRQFPMGVSYGLGAAVTLLLSALAFARLGVLAYPLLVALPAACLIPIASRVWRNVTSNEEAYRGRVV